MKKKLIISEEGKTNIERLALTIHVGLLTLLQKNIINIEEAENYFFSPYSAEYLKSLDVDEEIVELIWHTCELENIESLMPEDLLSEINRYRNKSIEIIKSLPKPNLPTKKWIDRI